MTTHWLSLSIVALALLVSVHETATAVGTRTKTRKYPVEDLFVDFYESKYALPLHLAPVALIRTPRTHAVEKPMLQTLQTG